MKNYTLGVFSSPEQADAAVTAIHSELSVPSDRISYLYKDRDSATVVHEGGSAAAEGAAPVAGPAAPARVPPAVPVALAVALPAGPYSCMVSSSSDSGTPAAGRTRTAAAN